MHMSRSFFRHRSFQMQQSERKSVFSYHGSRKPTRIPPFPSFLSPLFYFPVVSLLSGKGGYCQCDHPSFFLLFQGRCVRGCACHSSGRGDLQYSSNSLVSLSSSRRRKGERLLASEIASIKIGLGDKVSPAGRLLLCTLALGVGSIALWTGQEDYLLFVHSFLPVFALLGTSKN